MKPRRGVLIITPHGDGEAVEMWGLCHPFISSLEEANQ